MSEQFDAMPMSEQARTLMKEFAAAGWNIDKATIDRGAPWQAWRKIIIGASNDASGKDARIVADIHEYHVGDRVLRSVEFDLRGSAGLFALNLQAFSIPFEEAVDLSPRVASVLVAAWNAAMTSAKMPDPFRHF